MGSFYHQKYHRHNHHTIALSSNLYPDTSYDPIASYEQPFQGDFVLSGCMISKGLSGTSQDIGVSVSAGNISISAIGDVIFANNVYAADVAIMSPTINRTDIKVSDTSYYIAQLNKTEHYARSWKLAPALEINYTIPKIYDIIQEAYTNPSKNNAPEFLINILVTGTRPIQFKWFLNGDVILNEINSFIRTLSEGSYNLEMTNILGTVVSDTIYVPFDDDIILTNRGSEIVTNSDDNIITEYTYIQTLSTTYITENSGNYIST